MHSHWFFKSRCWNSLHMVVLRGRRGFVRVLLMVVDVVVLVLILDHVLFTNLQVPLFGSIVLFGRHRSILRNLAFVLRPAVLEPDFHLEMAGFRKGEKMSKICRMMILGQTTKATKRLT